MPTFEFTAQDGAKYRVQASDEQAAIDAFSEQTGTADQPKTGVGKTIAAKAADVISMGLLDETNALNAASGIEGTGWDYVPFAATAKGAYDVFYKGDKGAQQKYDQALKSGRDELKTMGEEHPVASLAGQAAGAATQAPFVLGRGGATLAAKVGQGAATSAGLGGAYGFGSGEGGVGNRLMEAGKGAAVGGVVGGALPVVAKGAVTAADQLVGNAAKMPFSSGAVARVGRAVGDDTPEAVAARLQELGPDAMMMEGGRNLSTQADALANQPGMAGNVILDAAKERAATIPGQLQSEADNILGASRGRVAELGSIMDEAKGAGPLYETAKKSDKVFNMGPLRTQVDTLIAETDGPIKSALEKVRDLRVFQDDIVRDVDPARLHGARQAIDDILSDLRPGTNAHREVTGVRKQVDKLLKDNVEGFAAADAKFSSAMTAKEAFEDGKGIFSKTISPDQVGADLGKLKEPQQKAYKLGVREALNDVLGNARNDANAAKALFERGWNKEKVAEVIGKEKADQFFKALDRNVTFSETYRRMLGNSQTAIRQSAQKEFPASVRGAGAREVGQKNLTGLALEGAYRLGDAALGGALERRRGGIATDAARMLTSQGPDAKRILDAIMFRRNLERAGDAGVGLLNLSPARASSVDLVTGPRDSKRR